MINQLDIAANRPETADIMRRVRDAQWWSNLAFAQRPIYVYRRANGLIILSFVTIATGVTLIATIHPDTFYMSGNREEWRESWMQMGDRRY